MIVRYTATALAEINEILSYIAADNQSGAAAIADEIIETVARILEHPEAAPVVYDADVRAVIVGRFEYRIFYVVARDELIIRNVRSTKRHRPWE